MPTLPEKIIARAGRRVRNLVISQCQNRIVVRGIADTFYSWQLVISACREFLSNSPEMRLDCRIEIAIAPLGFPPASLQLS